MIRLLHGDCIVRMAQMPESSLDSIVSDPPYGLSFMSKDFDKLGEGAAQQAWHSRWVAEAYRILVPGGVLKAFGGTRTAHRLAAAMEQAGFVGISFEAWGYGSGFPKSHNVSKSIDKKKGLTRKVVGYKRGVGGENLNDIVRGVQVRDTSEVGAKGVGAYGTGAKQVAVDVPVTAPASPEAEAWEGWGTALKPAWEPVVVGRKPVV